MHENHEKLDRLGRAILSSARNDLYLHMRFLDVALSGLDWAMNLNTPTVGTDGWSIQFNPRFLIDLYRRDTVLLNRAYLHMLLHCLLRHPLHRQGRQEDLWDLACDIAVESILDSIHNRCVEVLPSHLREDTLGELKEQLSVLTAEGIYRALEQMPPDYDAQLSLTAEFRRDDHRFWPGDQDRNQEQSGQQAQERDRLEQKWQQLSQKTQTGMETFFARYGDEAGDLLRLLTVENRERYDYRAFLRRFVTLREEMRVDPDSFDYASYALGLSLYGDIPLIEPLEYRERHKVRDFAIVIDTSDSCADGAVEGFLDQTRSVLSAQELFFDHARLHIIQCDAGVQSDTVVHSLPEFERFCSQGVEVKGMGGTDFRPAFAYVDRLIARGELSDLRGLIYFTDGFGAYPQRKPAYETAFVFYRQDYMTPEVPPWAIKIALEQER